MKYLIEIGFKSGNKICIWFNKFEVSVDSVGSITGLEWEISNGNNEIMDITLSCVEYILKIDEATNEIVK